ncbi:MAG TPA: efflux RND transporter periplasmic adaptor subunit [Chlamydiales bacterium]|jgi:multidrug resistance efflux pump|nr:efflux RND transporter periplasmic adaptor subunit [Chlamydiales bacterium]
MKRAFALPLPHFPWKTFLSFRGLAVFIALALSVGGFYWWKNVRPFFHIENAVLSTSSTEVRSKEAGHLLHCFFDEGECFQPGQSLFSLDSDALMDQMKEVDRKMAIYDQKIDQAKTQIDQNMEQYAYLQNELNLEGKTSELLEQILSESQTMQGNCLYMEKERAALQNERAEMEAMFYKRSCVAAFEGVVLRRFKQAGDEVLAGEPVFLVSNHQKQWIEAEIPEKILRKVRVGSPGWIEFISFPNKKWPAHVSWISPVVKEGRLKIRLTADKLPSYSGLSANVWIRTNSSYATAD